MEGKGREGGVVERWSGGVTHGMWRYIHLKQGFFFAVLMNVSNPFFSFFDIFWNEPI